MMNNKVKEYVFKVTTLQYGQPRPYADSIYEFEIESDQPETIVKNFCTKVLYPYNDSKEWYGDKMTFTKIDDNKYRYKVVSPYMD